MPVGAVAGAVAAVGVVERRARRVALMQMPESRSAGSMPMSSAAAVSARPSGVSLCMDTIMSVCVFLLFCVPCGTPCGNNIVPCGTLCQQKKCYLAHFSCHVAHFRLAKVPKSTYHIGMFDVEQIKEFMRRHELTQAELAKKLHCGRSTLVRVLSGQREVSPSLAARMQELINEQRDYITAEVPEDVAAQLQAWAEEAHSTIDAVVQQLLASLPKFKK